jgi:hypothetical protein
MIAEATDQSGIKTAAGRTKLQLRGTAKQEQNVNK